MSTKDELIEDDDVDVPAGHERVEIELTADEKKQYEAEDKKLKDEDDDVEPDHPDADDTERAAIRERRRQEKLERKDRVAQAIKRDKLELDFLRKQNDALERRLSGVEQRTNHADLRGLNDQLQGAIRDVNLAEQVIAKAVAAGNGEDVTKAMRYRDEAIAKANQLNAVKTQAEQQARTPAQPKLDDRVLQHAQDFMKDNKWYDPQGRDEDSAIVLAIDQSMAKDGYDPTTSEYWDELKKRASRRLPEKFKAPPTSRESRGGPAVGSGREHAPASTRREVYLSPERKQALVDAGVWDDPVLRQKYARRYAEYDRNNRA